MHTEAEEKLGCMFEFLLLHFPFLSSSVVYKWIIDVFSFLVSWHFSLKKFCLEYWSVAILAGIWLELSNSQTRDCKILTLVLDLLDKTLGSAYCVPLIDHNR